MSECVRIYLAGKVTGLDIAEVKKKFADKADELKRLGNSVFDPVVQVKLMDMSHRPYNDIMRFCITQMLKCDELHLLPDWEDSKGARMEKEIAEMVEMPVVYV